MDRSRNGSARVSDLEMSDAQEYIILFRILRLCDLGVRRDLRRSCLIHRFQTVHDICHHRQSGAGRMQRWATSQQRPGVWMLRHGEHFFRPTGFHDLAPVHDHDPVRNIRNHPQVMGDEQYRHAAFLLEIPDEFKDRSLHGNIQSCGGLIRNQQVGLATHRHSDHHPLLLASTELMGISMHHPDGIRKSYPFEKCFDLFHGFRLPQPQMLSKSFRHLFTTGHQRVQ